MRVAGVNKDLIHRLSCKHVVLWTISKCQPYGSAPHHSFVVIAPMIKKFGACMKLDVFYTVVTKSLWRHYYYIIITL